MNTEILLGEMPGAISAALGIIRDNGLVAFPTDTVYGLGSTAFDQFAIASIYEAKKRPIEKAIPILIAEISDLPKIVKVITPLAELLAQQFWPGPLTLVLPKRDDLPAAISASSTVGVRLPDHPVARSLFRLAGPMAVTSANISGGESPRTAVGVYAQLAGRIHLIIDGGITPGGVPSTVVDVTGEEPIIIREGPISLETIKSIL
jgi:L-threonylcarbamoyladenylate synthase